MAVTKRGIRVGRGTGGKCDRGMWEDWRGTGCDCDKEGHEGG